MTIAKTVMKSLHPSRRYKSYRYIWLTPINSEVFAVELLRHESYLNLSSFFGNYKFPQKFYTMVIFKPVQNQIA